MSFAISSFSLGRPSVKKEGDDGNNGECLLNLNQQTSQDVTYYITIDNLNFLNFCDLHVGYQFGNDPMTYIQVSGWTQDEEGDPWEAEVVITFPYDFIVARCEETAYPWSFGLYCLDGEEYDSTPYDTSTDFWDMRICCDEIELERQDDPVKGSGHFITSIGSDIYTLNTDKMEVITTTGSTHFDYYVYDRHGNPIRSFKGVSRDQNIEYIMMNSNLDSGIYFIKYLDNQEIRTRKIFKL